MKLRLFVFTILMLSSYSIFAQDFTIVEDEKHYFFLIPKAFANRTEVGGEIAKHNHALYPEANFAVETVYLPERIVAFQIQPFASHSAARAYYDLLINTESDLIADELTEQFFIISHTNLQRALRAGTIKEFLAFFRKTYY
ncbi:MAG: hypothetical protein AB8G22_25550 [Saprospiraceae bacterium]